MERTAATTTRQKMRGILNLHRRRLTSGVIEGFNGIAQAARAGARGHSRDRRGDLPQLVVGVVVDENGWPVAREPSRAIRPTRRRLTT